MPSCAPARRLVLFKDPLTTQEHLQLGATYEKENSLAAAEREYRAAARKDKRNAEALIRLGNLYYNQGRRKEAAAAFRKAVRIAPTSATAANNLAMIYATGGTKLKKAEKLARRAQTDGRIKPYALDTLATVLIKQKRYDEARLALEEAERSAPAGDPEFMSRLKETEDLLQREKPSGSN